MTAKQSINALRKQRYKFKDIAKMLKPTKGASIANLSAIGSGDREASEALTKALAKLANKYGG